MRNIKQGYDNPGFLTNGPLISVIVPVYNVESFLPKCINSILNQTYKHIEIILVDDGSTDGSLSIARDYAQRYPKISVIQHQKNEGLFQARISGFRKANGDYIATVDSDDYISVDWFRLLLMKAMETDADIVVGETILDNGQNRFYHNLDSFRLKDFDLYGQDILRAFMEQEGKDSGWHAVWKKLYRRDLVLRCLPFFEEFSQAHGHMVMAEDVAFSSAFLCFSTHAVNVHSCYYFYVQNVKSSTKTQSINCKTMQKSIQDHAAAMQFMKSMLEQCGAFKNDDIQCHFYAWQSHFADDLYNIIQDEYHNSNFESLIRSSFSLNEDYKFNIENRKRFFCSLITSLQPSFEWMETIKKAIVSHHTGYVSFDIFDTLVQRPFSEPSDLFYFLSEEFNRNTSNYINFYSLRISAERSCRAKKAACPPFSEEVTLDEIYEELGAITQITPENLTRMKQLEQKLELRFCTEKSSGKELYNLALQAEKKIILCCDTYLPKILIEKILEKAGYKNYTGLFLSSELKVTKSSCRLYRFAQKSLNCEDPSEIVHIGDDLKSDVDNAKQCGWNAFHTCKAMDLLKNEHPDLYTGESFLKIWGEIEQWGDAQKNMPRLPSLRNTIGLVANRIFSNPVVSINPYSDFNADPGFIGYAVLGPYLLALGIWLIKLAGERKIPAIHFAAREGYLVKRVFDLLNDSNTDSDFIQCSGLSLLIAGVNTMEDLYALENKLNIHTISPNRCLEYLSPLLSADKTQIQQLLVKNDLPGDLCFKTREEYYSFIELLRDNGFLSFSQLSQYRTGLKNYFSQQFKPGDYLFAMGYDSGMISALSDLLGFPINSLYLFSESAFPVEHQKNECSICECFMGNQPCVVEKMRKYLLSESEPSIRGSKVSEDNVHPVLEPYKKEYNSHFVKEVLQTNALAFIQDFCDTYREYKNCFSSHAEVLAAPLEYYLHNSKRFDREIFSTLFLDNSINNGGTKEIRVLDIWNAQSNRNGFDEFIPSTGVKGALKTFIDKHLPGKNKNCIPAQNIGLAPSIAVWLLKKTLDKNIKIGF